MCGIAGIINLSKNSIPTHPNQVSILQKMLFSRGPDASGLWQSTERNLILVVQRLATKDARKIANQPCWSTDKKIISIFNGEIYNHKELRTKLISLGYKFYSKNDTEVIANAYHYWGETFLKKLRGQFALVVYDKIKQDLIIARDEDGISPLYYSKIRDRFYFSSTPESIFVQLNQKLTLNEQAISDFIVADCISNGNTFFERINYLEPGQYIKFNLKREYHKKSKFSTYEKYNSFKQKSKNKDEYINLVFNLLSEGVKKRLEGDKEVGVFLSSGLDSSLVLGLIRHLYPKKQINTFTASFRDTLTNKLIGEQNNALKVSNYFNASNNIVPIDSRDLLKSIGSFSQPSASIMEFINHSLSRRAKEKKTEVILTGEGADEIFLGYDHNLALISKFNKNFSYLSKKFKFRSKSGLKLKSKKNIEDFYLGGGADIDVDENRDIIFNKINSRTDPYKIVIRNLIKKLKFKKNDDVEKIAFLIDFSLKIPEYFLRRSEEPSMEQGVELRFPFLQRELKELVFNIPLEIKLGKDLETKYLLREVSKKILPKHLIFPKLPIGVPAMKKEYFKRSGQKYKKPAFKDLFYQNFKEMKEIIMDGKYREIDIFNEKFLIKTIKHQSNKKTCFYDKMLWKIWNIAKWYERLS